MEQHIEPVGTVNLGAFVQGRIDAGQGCQIYDGGIACGLNNVGDLS